MNKNKNYNNNELHKTYELSLDLVESVVRRGLEEEYYSRRTIAIEAMYTVLYDIVPVIFIIFISSITISLILKLGSGHNPSIYFEETTRVLQTLLVFYEILIAIIIFLLQTVTKHVGITYVLSAPSQLWILSAWNTVLKNLRPAKNPSVSKRALLSQVIYSRKYTSIQNVIAYSVIMIVLYLFFIEIISLTNSIVSPGVLVLLGIIISFPVVLLGIFLIGGIVNIFYRFTSISKPPELDIFNLTLLTNRKLIKTRKIIDLIVKRLKIHILIFIILMVILFYFINRNIIYNLENIIYIIAFSSLYVLAIWFAWVKVRRLRQSTVFKSIAFSILMFSPVIVYILFIILKIIKKFEVLNYGLFVGELCSYGVLMNLSSIFIINIIFYLYLRAISYAPVLESGFEGGKLTVIDYLARYAGHVVSRVEGMTVRGVGEESTYRRLLTELLLLLYFQNLVEPLHGSVDRGRFGLVNRRVFINNSILHRLSVVLRRGIITGGLLVPAIATLAGNLLRLRFAAAEGYEGESVYDHDRLARATIVHFGLLTLLIHTSYSVELVDKMRRVMFGLEVLLPKAFNHVETIVICKLIKSPFEDIKSYLEHLLKGIEMHLLRRASLESLEREVRRKYLAALERSAKKEVSLNYCDKILQRDSEA